MNLSYRYRLYPDEFQREFLNRLIFSYNQFYNASLNLIQNKGKELYESGTKHNVIFKTLYTDLCNAMRNREDIVYKTELIQEALRDAFRVLFSLIKQKKPFNLHFKNSSRFTGSFPKRQTMKFSKKISLFGIRDIDVKVHRSLPSGYRIMGYRIVRELDRYFLAVNLANDADDKEMPTLPATQDVIGMDINSGNLTFSNGLKIDFIKSVYPELEKKRLRHQKSLSAKRKGSRNRKKAQKLLFKASRKIKNRRKDELHKRALGVLKAVTEKVIAVEDLNLKEMTNRKQGNKTLRKNLLHQGHRTFLDLLSYKATLFDRFVIRVNPAYTSQTCSCCGSLRKTPLSMREYHCENCNMTLDRDVNAALNIKRLGLSLCSPSLSSES